MYVQYQGQKIKSRKIYFVLLVEIQDIVHQANTVKQLFHFFTCLSHQKLKPAFQGA